MKPDEIIDILSERLTYHHSIWKEYSMDNDEWLAAKSPHVWKIEDSFEGYIFLSDCGYGWLAIISPNKDLEISKSGIVISRDEKVIGLSESYGMPRPILYKKVRS